MSPTPDQNPEESGTSLSGAITQLASIEAQHLPDLVVPLRETLWTPEGSLSIPSFGTARPNDWAKHQVGSLLGVRFDKWFATAGAEERAEEMTRRLRRANGNVRLRLSQSKEGTVLRAVVSPHYTAIQDTMLLGVLDTALQGNSVKVHRLDITDRMTALIICIGEPQSIGGIVDKVWGAITVINSGVGWSGLSVSASLLRLVCKNGMKAPLVNAAILKVRHRGLDARAIQNELSDGLKSLPGNLVEANRVLALSTSWAVRDVEAEAHSVLREAGMVRRHLVGVMSAYQMEPHPSVFGLSQAMTLHAHDVEPEERVALEDLAGTYVARSAP